MCEAHTYSKIVYKTLWAYRIRKPADVERQDDNKEGFGHLQ